MAKKSPYVMLIYLVVLALHWPRNCAASTASSSLVRLGLQSADFPAGEPVAKKEIQIRLRPDLSGSVSTEFVARLAGKNGGGTFKFYRAERWGVLQVCAQLS
jgi:hypothetical protein